MYEYGHIPINNSFYVREQQWNIPESHIVDIWIREAKPGRVFTTNDGKEVTICSIGKRNYSGGADFTNADILFNGNLIHGDIEIHRSPNNWIQHGHHLDRMYDSVILHVVLRNDEHLKKVSRKPLSIPLVVLEDNLHSNITSLWQSAVVNNASSDREFLLCAGTADYISTSRKYAMLHILTAKRFQKKCDRMQKRFYELRHSNNIDTPKHHWKQLFYELLMESLGYANNKLSMRSLTHILTNTFWERIHFSHLSIRDRFIILIGTAGLIPRLYPEFTKEEMVQLEERWNEVKRIHSIETDSTLRWNYGGLRPMNDPHRRLMSVAAFLPIILSDKFLIEIISFVETFNPNDDRHRNKLRNLFSIPTDHFIFKYHVPQFGDERIDEIIINIVAPFIYILGCGYQYKSLSNHATRLYFQYKSSARNSITVKVQKNLRVETNNLSGIHQGLIELHNSFCSNLQCHDCLIGRQQL